MGGKEAAADELGLHTKAQAQQRLTALGRKGKLPWCEPDVAAKLPYLKPSTLVLVPTAHALLRGVLKSLLEYTFKTKVSSVAEHHPIVFNSDARKAVSVSSSLGSLPAALSPGVRI